MKKLFITLLATILLNFVFGQKIDIQKIDSFIDHIEENDRGIGSLSIFHDGTEIYNRSFGQESLPDVQYNADTKYQIGSITKTITAILVFKLIEKKQLNLDDKLSSFFPNLPNANKITIKNLLEHTSGLSDYANKKDSLFWLKDRVKESEILEEIIKQGVDFEPNEKFKYSNSGYFLLTKIIEKLYNQNYFSIVDQQVVKPLKLEHFTSHSIHKINCFNSYLYTEKWEESKDLDFSNVIGVGDIAATAKDLNSLLYCLFNNQLIKKKYVKQMMPIKKETFGRGLMLAPFYQHNFYGHGGTTFGTNSFVAFNKKDKIGIAYSINGERYPSNDFALGILSILYEKEREFPNFNSMELKEEDLEKFLGTYSTAAFPLKLTILKEKNTLKAKATGQPEFPLECYEENKFKFEQAKIKIEFNPKDQKLTLIQSGQRFEMTKEQ
ncbi:MAG: D-alanyl-D-alanine carboxypeptidase [Lentimonas sp.]|jgi:D-alanyl-D-alanine carboxypeptidase